MIGWWPGYNFSVVARSLLIRTINLGLPWDYNELHVAKISLFATSALTAGKQPLYCMSRADLCGSGEPLQSRSIQLRARRISDAGDPIKPLLREDVFSVRRSMPSAARASPTRSQGRLTTLQFKWRVSPPRYRCTLSTGYETLCVGPSETCGSS
jgi:hypothetical protein